MVDPVVSEQVPPPGSPPRPPPPVPSPPAHRAGGGPRKALIEWTIIIAATVVVVLLLKTFLVQAFFIPSGSMEPTLKPGDRVLVAKAGMSIHRGDIIVFKKPPTDTTAGIDDLIKRVIGLPGDQVSAEGGYVYIDGKKLGEHWLPRVDRGITTNVRPQTVPPNEYFVLGDNRINSDDSRFIGDIPGRLVVGKAFVRIWPLSSVTFF